jgi:hypothetical protein
MCPQHDSSHNYARNADPLRAPPVESAETAVIGVDFNQATA